MSAKKKGRQDAPPAVPTAAVAPEAAAAVVRDLEGGRHRLDELWRDGPVVLVFLRHFG
jgi:hypothetical protein